MENKYLVNLKGKDYPVYAGVLNEAHKKDLLGIETKLVQIPTEENGNTAIIKAIVYLQFSGGTIGIKDTKGVKQFEAYGDANPKNVNSIIVTALIRMAETRAKGRALRDAVNIGDTLAEEIPEEDPFDKIEPMSRCSDCGAEVTKEVEKYSMSVYKKKLCRTCQDKLK